MSSPDQPARMSSPLAPRRPMNPCDRLRLCGPIRPMERPVSLIERLLFG